MDSVPILVTVFYTVPVTARCPGPVVESNPKSPHHEVFLLKRSTLISSVHCSIVPEVSWFAQVQFSENHSSFHVLLYVGFLPFLQKNVIVLSLRNRNQRFSHENRSTAMFGNIRTNSRSNINKLDDVKRKSSSTISFSHWCLTSAIRFDICLFICWW